MVRLLVPTIKLYTFSHFNHSVLRPFVRLPLCPFLGLWLVAGLLRPLLTTDSTTLHRCNGLLLWHSLIPLPACYQFSQGKFIRFLFMQPLHLRLCVLYSIGLLFLLQHHPHIPALYEVSVRRLEYLPPASFRFVVAHDTLALG